MAESGKRVAAHEIPTEKIAAVVSAKVAQAVACPPSCRMEDRVKALENTVDEHSAALNDGRVNFATIAKDLETLTIAVGGLKDVISRVGWFIVLAVLGAVVALVVRSP